MLDDCPFCHHKKATLYAKGHTLRAGGVRDVYVCDECGLLYPRPRMDDTESLDYQTRLYTEHGKKKMRDPSKVMEAQELRRWEVSRGNLVNIGDLVRNKMTARGDALDIGTFSGEFCYLLQSMGFMAYGLELCNDAARFAREKGLKVFTGVFPNRIPLELAEMKFSLISMIECMYYIVDLKRGLNKVYEMLEDNGFFLLKCHQGRSSYYYDKKVSLFERYGDGVQGMPSLESLKYCLERSGFEILHMSGAMTRATAPVNLDRFINENRRLQKLFIFAESFLNTIYEAFILDAKDAERLIVLTKKKMGVKDV